MAPKSSSALKPGGAKGKSSDARKGGRAGGGGSAADSGGAMATVILQKKAVGPLSSGVEALVRSLLQSLQRQEEAMQQQQLLRDQQHHARGHRGGGGAAVAAAADAPPAAPPPPDARTLVAWGALWDSLAAAGFSVDQIRRAVEAMPRGRAPSLDAALDWLCLYLPAAELPQRFRSTAVGTGVGAAPVRIVSRAADTGGEGGASGGGAEGGEGGADRAWDAESDEGEGGSGEEEAGAEAGQAGEEAQAAAAAGGAGMKEWILRYMEEEEAGSSGDEQAAAGGASSASSVADFEWELWGDPREVARRRAERARSRLPLEERRRQLAEEWGRAKEAAARAKTSGDRDKQKEAGLMLRDLKQEMAGLGASEAQLDALLGGQPLPQAGGRGAAADKKAAAGPDKKGDKDKDKDRSGGGHKGKAAEREKGGAKAGKEAAVEAKGKEKDKGDKDKKEKDKKEGKDKDKEKHKDKDKDKDGEKSHKHKDKDKDKDKDKEKERRDKKEKEKLDKEARRARRREKERTRAKDRPASSSESEEEAEAGGEEPWAQPAGATAPPPVAVRRAAEPKPEPEEIPESWEEHEETPEPAPPEPEPQPQPEPEQEAGAGEASGEEEATGSGRASSDEDGSAEEGGQTAEPAAAKPRAGGVDEEAPPSFDLFEGGEADTGSAPSAPAAPPKPKAEEEESFALPGLFDDDGSAAADAGAPAPPPSALLRAEAEAARPGGGKAGKATKGAKPAAPPAQEAPRTPRALLAQLCQKQAWSQPRYERLPAESGLRYSAVLDLGPARGIAKKRNLYGIRVYSLPPRPAPPPANDAAPSEADAVVHVTWPDAAAGQDAAAARALFEVAPALQLHQSTFQAMAPQWRALWLEWEAAAGSAAAAAAAAGADAAAAAAGSAAAAARQAEEEKLAALREMLSRPPPPPPSLVLVPPPKSAATAAAALEAATSASGTNSPAPEPADAAPAQAPAEPEGADAGAAAAGTDPEAEAEAELAEEDQEAVEEGGGEPMSHHDGDAVEQEEWEDMVAAEVGRGEDDEGPEGEEDLDPEAAAEAEAAEEEARAAAAHAQAAAAEAEQAARAEAEARRASAASASLRAAMEAWVGSPAGRAMAAARSGLPIAAVRGEVLAALRERDVVVVSGDTGCGKTTQVPQYLLEDAVSAGHGGHTHVVVTQPRRIAAISVAERVAEERGEPPPGSPGPASSVGYHVRLGAAVTRHTHLTFCTTGILLRRLAGDPSLKGVTHVVVDEVHERSLQSDFLIALLRDLLAARRGAGGGPGSLPPLKVVLMSATLDAALFANYFGGCPVLHAAGRTFPVSRLFLEDVYAATGYRLAADAPAALKRHGPGAAAQYARHGGGTRAQRDLVSRGFGDDEALAAPLNPCYDPEAYREQPMHVKRNLARLDESRIDYDLLEALLTHIDTDSEPGAVLVFLPGIGEINFLYDRLTAQRAFSPRGGPAQRCTVLPLHSAVPPAGQRAALKPPPPGLRKVVLATNIAETSLTIEDVVAVVDTGRHKERRFNPARSMSMLVEDWVSAASAQQRAGRAGRVRPGVCYATYTAQRYESGLRRYGAPEITRVPLEELVLQILLMGLGPVADFLARVLEPPQPRAVAAALEVLRQVGALEPPQSASASASAAPAPPEDPSPPAAPTSGASAPATDPSTASPAPAPCPRERLSPLGRHLALLPVSPRLGKLLVAGALLGCLAPAATIAAAMSHKSPFMTPTEDRAEAERARRALAAPGAPGLAAGQQSDHLLLVAAYELWRTAASPKHGGGPRNAAAVARKHFLHLQTLEQLSEMRCQLAAMLADSRLVVPPGRGGRGDGEGEGGGGGGGRGALAATAVWLDDPQAPWNRFARDPLVVKAALAAALSPALAAMGEDSPPTGPPRWLDAAPGPGACEEVLVHPSSVLAGSATPSLQAPFVVYLEKVKTTRLFLRDVTVVSPLTLLLFGGPTMAIAHAEGAVVVGGSGSGSGREAGGVRIACRAQTAVLVRQMRGALSRLLERRFEGTGGAGGGPGGEAAWRAAAEGVVGVVRHMLREEDEQRAAAVRLL